MKYEFLESSSRELAYEKDFRAWLREHQTLPKAVLGLVESAQKKGVQQCEGNVCVTCIDINAEEFGEFKGLEYSRSFKISVGGKNFFMKMERDELPKHGGPRELRDALMMQEELDASPIPGVEVVKPLLGYSDTHGNSYYVSEWHDLSSLGDVLSELERKGKKERKQVLLSRLAQLQQTLGEFLEVTPANMFYDKKAEKIVIFDTHL